MACMCGSLKLYVAYDLPSHHNCFPLSLDFYLKPYIIVLNLFATLGSLLFCAKFFFHRRTDKLLFSVSANLMFCRFLRPKWKNFVQLNAIVRFMHLNDLDTKLDV